MRPSFGRGEGAARSGDRSNQKLQQLCRQVQRTLSLMVPGELADPVLQDLAVMEVLPAPDASRLLVRLATRAAAADVPHILERLERVRGRLRSEVAAAVTRKRAPELMFLLCRESEVTP
jgi:ribosome-binding factor A